MHVADRHAEHKWVQVIRVRLKIYIIGNLETMHDSDLPTFLMSSLRIIFKRIVILTEILVSAAAVHRSEGDCAIKIAETRQERKV